MNFANNLNSSGINFSSGSSLQVLAGGKPGNADCRSARWWQSPFVSIALSTVLSKMITSIVLRQLLNHFFQKQISYPRFISLLKSLSFLLFVLQKSLEKESKGIAFIDSTLLSVCHICRASSHRVFKWIASQGKTSALWFFGLKLHLVVNHHSNWWIFMINSCLTRGLDWKCSKSAEIELQMSIYKEDTLRLSKQGISLFEAVDFSQAASELRPLSYIQILLTLSDRNKVAVV